MWLVGGDSALDPRSPPRPPPHFHKLFKSNTNLQAFWGNLYFIIYLKEFTSCK